MVLRKSEIQDIHSYGMSRCQDSLRSIPTVGFNGGVIVPSHAL
jgi:hypothetical protein